MPEHNDVAIVMGSESDRDLMSSCEKALTYFGIGYMTFILSAHRTPDATVQLAKSARERGYKVIIAGAGMAAHLPGTLAAHTTLPVIGVPINSSPLSGVDALYSIVQMPRGVPVAAVAINGAMNAAVLAAQIISLGNAEVKEKLDLFKKEECSIK